MRKWALLVMGGALWLFLAAIPALADGGPHISAANSGTSTLTSDSCAGCHRTHTAQGQMLLAESSEEALCLSCHGAAGTGATTDVASGVQYRIGTGAVRGDVVLGALRNGGFEHARIDSANPSRLTYFRTATALSQRPKVGVLAAGEAVTSTHLTGPGIVWGNGAAGSGVGKDMELGCTGCHNPHGNGQYRILRPVPTNSGATAGVVVDDAPLPPPGDTRNYTVIQVRGTQGTDSSYLLYASQVVGGGYTATEGDYFHRTVPWNPPACDPAVNAGAQGTNCATSNDAPNGRPATGTFGGAAQVAFNDQISQWCTQCHSRYYASTNPNPGTEPGPSGGTPATAQAWWFPRPGEDIYKYQHQTTTNRACTTCHVSHGSNAAMDGVYSGDFPYPDGTTSASSRLLKIDNRGTCQACHDPTESIAAGTYYGPLPMPGSP